MRSILTTLLLVSAAIAVSYDDLSPTDRAIVDAGIIAVGDRCYLFGCTVKGREIQEINDWNIQQLNRMSYLCALGGVQPPLMTAIFHEQGTQSFEFSLTTAGKELYKELTR